jgi:hypothetical protein
VSEDQQAFPWRTVERFPVEAGVYFLEASSLGLVKIGCSDDVARRISKMKLIIPVEVNLLRVIAGGQREEVVLHHRFAAHRVKGEWFTLEPIRDAIEALDPFELVQGNRLTCIDCGRIRSTKARARSQRCKSCSNRQRAQPAIELSCVACGESISSKGPAKLGSKWTGICRPCGMRKAWTRSDYPASVMAARAARRRKCRRCSEPLTSPRSTYHPACWEAESADRTRVRRAGG